MRSSTLVGDALAPELVERIAERSGGNALFVEELLRTWIGTGVLTRENGGGWALAADPQEVGLPPTVQAITPRSWTISCRRRVLLRGMHQSRGAGFRSSRFRRSGSRMRRVRSPRSSARVRREAREDAALGLTLRFRHALLRDTAYASLARADRATLHLDFAEWLAGRLPEALPGIAEVIARHYAAAIEPRLRWQARSADASAGKSGSSRRWFQQASEVAGGVAAWESARALAERALELRPTGEPSLRARRLERLARTAVNSTGAAEAEQHAREALESTRASEDRAGLSSAALLLGRLLFAQVRFAESEQLADELLAAFGEARDPATIRLLVMRADAALGGRDAYEDAGRDSELALEIGARAR